MVENFDEWLAIRQSFPYKPLSLNVSLLKPTCQFVKVFPHKTFVLYGIQFREYNYITA